MRTVPLWSCVRERREVVDASAVAREVVHYSIPNVDAYGTGAPERSDTIQSQKLRVYAGDILISRLNPRKPRVVSVGDHPVPSMASTEFVPLIARGFDQRFLQYALSSEAAASWLDAHIRSVTRSHQRVEPEIILRLPVVQFPLEEQRRIADFLDDQVARIDAARACLTQQIAVVDEARTSLLVAAYGVAPSPDFLEGYTSDEVLSIRALTHKFIAGGTPSTNDVRYWDDEVSPWISIGDMMDGGLTACTAKGLTPDGLAAARLSLATSGAVLFAMYASVGKTTVTAMPCMWNQAILGLLPRAQVDTDFLLGWLELIRPVLPFIARSSTQANLNADQVGRLRVPRRDYATQVRIGEERRRVIEQTRCSAQFAQRASSLLDERKRALITACVTGELNVGSASGRAQS